MEKDGYIRRSERAGISTTPRGTRIAMEIIALKFEEDIL
jgi:Mn-dependent DtxR family transcriptional regulator